MCSFDPVDHGIQHFIPNFQIVAPGARGHVKGMIGIRKQLECRARAELLGERFEKLQVCELITRALQEQHWKVHVEEVLSALVRRLPWRMKREPQENEAAHSGQRSGSLCL